MNVAVAHERKPRGGRGAFLAFACFSLVSCSSIQGARGEYVDFIRPDLRPPLVEASSAADSLWGPLAESARGDGIAESRRQELNDLVRRFAPTLVLPRGDYVEHQGIRIRLLPTDVDLFDDTLSVDIVSTSPYLFREGQTIVPGDLDNDSLIALADHAGDYQADPDLLLVTYYDFPGTSPREWWESYARLRTGSDSARWSTPTVYGHPFIDSQSRVVIQYWFFFPFNDFMGNHEGDWERINVIASSDRRSIEQVHYYFHARSIILPDTISGFEPEIVDSTHPVVYAGGRMYNIFDYPVRWLSGERNEGSHALFPFPGEWEAAAGLGAPESVMKVGNDSSRVIRHSDFAVHLLPEPSRFDYSRTPDVLRKWGWLLLPVRFGFPAAPSMGSGLGGIDVGNRAWFGPAYHPGWNRTAPGLLYSAYQPKKLSTPRSFFEDLLQPWNYLYIFRTPRYIHDVRGSGERKQLERLGLAPRGGWAERGFGTTLLGVQLMYPRDELGRLYGTSVGISFWRNLWGKVRFGGIEFQGGYQKLRQDNGSALFVYPITASVVVRGPDRKFRPYVGGGAGMYGWESRAQNGDGTRVLTNGWGPGWTTTIGLEYYMRTRVAFDVGVHYHATSSSGGLPDEAGMEFVTVWMGHYVRF